MNSANSRLQKAKRRRNDGSADISSSELRFSTSVLNDNHEDEDLQNRQHKRILSLDSTPKRNCTRDNTTANSPHIRLSSPINNVSPTSSSKFSANDRLKKYRQSLGNRRDEIVKVHQALVTSNVNNDDTSRGGNASPVNNASPIRSNSPKKSRIPQFDDGVSRATSIKRRNEEDELQFPPNKKVKLNKQEGEGRNNENLRFTSWEQKNNEESVISTVACSSSTSSRESFANERLKKYRKSLEKRGNEIVKVHRALSDSTPNRLESIEAKVPDFPNLKSKISAGEEPIFKVKTTDDDVTKAQRALNGNEDLRNKLFNSPLKGKSTPKPNRTFIASGITSTPKENQVFSAPSYEQSRTNKTSKNKSLAPHDRLSKVEASKRKVRQGPALQESNASGNPELSNYRKERRTIRNSNCSPSNFSAQSSGNVSISNVGNLDDDQLGMDWSPIEQEEVVSDIQKLREDVKEKIVSLPSFVRSPVNKASQVSNDDVYVVVDTNIFISHLGVAKELTTFNSSGKVVPIVIVPWMVIQELDYFKDGRAESTNMRNCARRAVKFINDSLASRSSRLRGQTVYDAVKQDASSSNPDDGILFCCVQLVRRSKTTILLSNDVNLRNKALIHGISSYGPDDITTQLSDIISGNDSDGKLKAEHIESAFTRLCSGIIESEMQSAYGAATYNLVTRPPWNLKQCLIYFKRFWTPVFSLLIPQKQFVKKVDDFIYFYTSRKGITSEADVEEFTKLCLSVCVYLKNCLTNYKEAIVKCIDDVQRIAN